MAPCILAPGLQAEIRSGKHWGYPFARLVMEYGVDMISFPCPESLFGGFDVGLGRGKHGIDYYMSLDGYHEHCERLAVETVQMIVDMKRGGYDLACILGVEHSPTCAVRYMYSHRGMLKRSGIFYELLERGLKNEGIEISRIGINRRYPNKAFACLEQVLLRYEEKEEDDGV